MIDLSKFKSFDFSEGKPTVSFTKNGVTFNKAVTIKLGKPEYVQLLIDEDDKQMVLVSCEEGAENAQPYFRERGKDILSVRWNSKDFRDVIARLMEWDVLHKTYRVDGDYYPDDNLILFDLNSFREGNVVQK